MKASKKKMDEKREQRRVEMATEIALAEKELRKVVIQCEELIRESNNLKNEIAILVDENHPGTSGIRACEVFFQGSCDAH